MKKKAILFCFLIVLILHAPAQAKFPRHIGGFALGDDFTDYPLRIDMDTCRKVLFNKFLGEGEIIPQTGFKSGLIAYGLCDAPNKIVRIKLKYADGSKSFFNTLFNRYKQQLGPPNEYKGDAFQTLIAWKWSFTNEKNEKISLTLQHNTMNTEEKMGNAVKLSLTSQIERERECFKSRSPKKSSPPDMPARPSRELWDLFIPH